MDTEIIYNKIILYYDIIDKIREEIFKLKDLKEEKKFQTLMPFVDNMKTVVDGLMEKYVIFSKDTTDEDQKQEILNILGKILDMVYEYKNVVYSLYQKNA